MGAIRFSSCQMSLDFIVCGNKNTAGCPSARNCNGIKGFFRTLAYKSFKKHNYMVIKNIAICWTEVESRQYCMGRMSRAYHNFNDKSQTLFEKISSMLF